MQDIDTLMNTDRYGIFFNFTCYNNALDQADALSRHFMLNPTGGGAGYVGSTHMEFSAAQESFHLEMLNKVFSGEEVRIGKVLLDAKDKIVPRWSYSHGSRWLLFFATMYLGDPQMEVWTAEPQAMTITSPATLPPGQQSFDVTVSSSGGPVSSALVCIYMEDDVYELAFTDANGVAAFSNVDFTTEGSASIVATKHNYFPAEELLTISASCCVQRVGDANGIGGDEPTLNDVSVMIDAKFISGYFDGIIACLAEADINLSGGADPTCDDITMGDISILQDYLFITGPSLGLPACL